MFWVDDNRSFTYGDLLVSLSSIRQFPKYCINNDPYTIFVTIILSIINRKSIVILDYDFSKNEIEDLIGTTDNLENEYKNTCSVDDIEQLISELRNNPDSNISLFTSGTTGIPKKVVHTISSLTRAVQVTAKHKDDVWGFAYNPSHIAGLQVFFQAIMSGNTMINLFKKDQENIAVFIDKYKITHLSATPTFFRLLKHDIFESVKRITSGGERLDSDTEIKIQKIFPKAKLRNVYATTESGTLFSSAGEYFTIIPELRDLIKIVDNEIVIHSSLVKVLDFDKEWYYSGDMVDIISPDPLKFEFIARKDDMINIGGMKVNPNEVEDVIYSIEGVKDVCVYSQENSVTSNILCADVISELSEREIRILLKNKLQPYKIPRIINNVEELKLTRTGKKKR
jgi:acyl-coenzyme A synthetase/AMP-(fatty) acid ligase